MPPTMKTRSFNVRSCKKSLPENKEKSSLAKKPSSKKSTSKPRVKQKKPMVKRERLSFPSTSSACSTSAATSQKCTNLKPYTPVEQQIPMKERSYLTLPSTRYEVTFKSTPESARVTPSMLKNVLTSYKHSPAYLNLKKKRFNTDFKFTKPRGDRNIEIFTPEEDKSPIWTENLPKIENRFTSPPGELYADIFKNMPDLSDLSCSDSDADKSDFDASEKKLKKNRKKKGKKSFGYDGEPLRDDEIIPNWDYIL